ncbi:MAG: type II CAAX endopeptidase family protein [Actinomycetaceae bacterium]|nr:type II CAAX endopeptidase family protein [Actinomycetaceae bacterium]
MAGMRRLTPSHNLTQTQIQQHLRWREINPWQQFFLSLLLLIGAEALSFAPHDIITTIYRDQGAPALLADSSLVVGLLIGAIVSYLGFIGIIRWRAKRPAWELSTNGALRELSIGLLIGALAVSAPILVLWALGMYHVTGVRLNFDIIMSLAIGIGAGFTEEIFLRGFVLRLTERSMGTIAALLFSSLIFGLGHIGNTDVTVWGAIAIGVEAGILLGAAYLLTRRLWLAIGIHAAWNAVQGGLWSSAVSGTGQRQGLLVASFDGPDWLTGGAMGIEGAVLALVSCLAVASWMLVRMHQEKLFVAPSNWPWRWRQAQPFRTLDSTTE